MFFWTRAKLEKQLMNEIKTYAKVENFPYNDAKIISEALAAYNEGSEMSVLLYVMKASNTLEKYPYLYENWDDLMIKYKELGLFPKWRITQR